MTTLRPFRCEDLFHFNNVNLDALTEIYGLPFYLSYMAHWPEYFQLAEAPDGKIMGYMMGKAEGNLHNDQWHGHVTCLSVAAEFRRLGLAAILMKGLEDISEKLSHFQMFTGKTVLEMSKFRKNCFFVDLFVKVSNNIAVNMYKKLGYIVYRTVLDYYSGDPDEDAYDMRKALSRDVHRQSVIPLTHPVTPDEIE